MDRKQAARDFAKRWKGRGDEKSETQTFWNELLQDLFGVARPGEVIEYEKRVSLKNKGFIDGYIPSTRVLIEQKSRTVNLDKPQDGHDGMTPYAQAKNYYDGLPLSMKGRWIVVCNFAEIRVHDMEAPDLLKTPPEVIKLEDLPREWRKLQFLIDDNAQAPKEVREEQLSVSAGELVGKLYDALKKRYVNPEAENSLRSLNILCVRVVFLLYAEDAGLFPKGAFHDYLLARKTTARDALIQLFHVLNQRPEERDPYLDADLKAFPYVNGGLFEERDIEIPHIGGEPLEIILGDMSEGFDWSGISPTIFGAVFESTLSGKTRRGGGMHYTSIENIHRVIDPLFLNGLRAKLDAAVKSEKNRKAKLLRFQEELASLTFLDPACGSGNFLTETYLSLRRMENRVISELSHGQGQFAIDEFTPIQVSIGQFYGIEINDFAVAVARTALWIAEAQMMKETRAIVDIRDDVLPLKNYNHIVEGNALTLDWGSVVERPDYVMGNPPFVGASMMTKEQKAEAVAIFGKVPRGNSIDYVGAWDYKAAEMMRDTSTHAAFVSTNSITQGEQIAALWGKLLNEYKIHIDFAWRTFVWNSETKDKAHVHVVIIGFSQTDDDVPRRIYDVDGNANQAKNISPYLIDAPSVLVQAHGTPICDVPRMTKGNYPSDGGNLILSQEERDALVKDDPAIVPCVRRYIGSRDFINNDETRYCLWLKDVSANLYRHNREVMRRIDAVRQMRLASTAAPTRAMADMPYRFFSTPQTDAPCLCVPEVSSERRKYIPMGFLVNGYIASSKLLIIPHAELYHFGVLISRVHMAWMRTVAGRLEMRYQYSGAIVYNTFPWP
ncbi:MAG: class I SAM-dependent DNA methyltransferase, partial [Synergistaceae bacterium]|nr:class I SAM-dependent DNA methyltransferase [Synergistaceae bacterium]